MATNSPSSSVRAMYVAFSGGVAFASVGAEIERCPGCGALIATAVLVNVDATGDGLYVLADLDEVLNVDDQGRVTRTTHRCPVR